MARSKRDIASAVLVLLVAWELGCVCGIRGLATPAATAGRLFTFAASGDLLYHTAYTMAAAATGLVLGGAPAIALAFALHGHDSLKRVISPFLAAGYGAPKVALAPLLVLWFGIGIESKIVLVSSIVFFVIFFLTHAGLESVGKPLVDSARIMGAGRYWVTRGILWPSCAPYVFAAVRVAIPQAIGGAVVAELISSNRGLGYVIQAAATDFDASGVFAGVAVLALVVMVLGLLLDGVERRVLAWRPAESAVDGTDATL